MRKKKSKVLFPLLILFCMIISGCGKGTSVEQDGRADFGIENAGKSSPESTADNGNADANQESSGTEGQVKQKTEMKGRITVSSFLEDEYLNVAAKDFMKKYPKVKVVINEYGANIAQPSERDYQTLFNTKLMSGEAEDIIMNSFLPVEKYIEMGAFEDFSTYIKQSAELNEKNYFMNVLRAAEQETGKIYLLPYGLRFDVLCFDNTLLKEQRNVADSLKNRKKIGFGEGMELAEQLVKNTGKRNAFLSLESQVRYMDRLFWDGFSEFVDATGKEVHIDSPKYIHLLESVKKLQNSGRFPPDDMDYYNTEHYIAGAVDYDVQAAFYALDQMSASPHSMPLSDQSGKVMMNANNCLLMNSKSENKALAWEFIKYLLSDKMQSAPSLPGIPVSKKGFKKAAKRQYDFYSENNAAAGSLEDYEQILEDWTEQINGCDTLDTSLVSIMEEENEKYFTGKQTAEKTAGVLQRKVEQYFNE